MKDQKSETASKCSSKCSAKCVAPQCFRRLTVRAASSAALANRPRGRAGCALVLMLIMLASPILLSAHERRTVGANGQYTMIIGFKNEPAFQGEMNGVDIILSRTADQKPLSVAAGDIVQLSVEVQLRAAEAYDSAIVRWAELAAPVPAFETPNRYNSYFRASEEGTYAFHIKGVVSDASNLVAGPLQIDETFVCGKGTKAAQGAFNCVRAPQVIPSRFRGR